MHHSAVGETFEWQSIRRWNSSGVKFGDLEVWKNGYDGIARMGS